MDAPFPNLADVSPSCVTKETWTLGRNEARNVTRMRSDDKDQLPTLLLTFGNFPSPSVALYRMLYTLLLVSRN